MSQAKDPASYGNFDYGEIEYVIQLSCRMQSIDKIQSSFARFTGGVKGITGKVIRQIQDDNLSRIKRESALYRKFIDGSPLSHPRLVCDMWMELIDSCREERPSVWNKETESWDLAPDNGNAIRALKEATAYLRDQEKLKLEKIKQTGIRLPEPKTTKVEEEEEQANLVGGWELE